MHRDDFLPDPEIPCQIAPAYFLAFFDIRFRAVVLITITHGRRLDD